MFVLNGIIRIVLLEFQKHYGTGKILHSGAVLYVQNIAQFILISDIAIVNHSYNYDGRIIYS